MEDQRRMCKGSLFAYFAWSSITGLHSAHRTRRALLQVGWDKDIMWQCCQCYFNFHLVFVLPSHRPWLRTTLGLQRSWKQGASLHAYCSKWFCCPFVFCNLASRGETQAVLGLVSRLCIRGDLFGISPGRAWWKHVKESLPQTGLSQNHRTVTDCHRLPMVSRLPPVSHW